ncbi:hypothetical protein Adt_18467 [Abeliophyllum distichum]|uniref:Uncharacterized protein n=1 Tax=Abeliophyllum distichum TaxID=126358 RepID=A0ABD1TJH3_9LAMI
MFLLSCASMADVMSHRGGGAGDPPHQPPRQLDSVCKSVPPSKRGISRGLNLQKLIENNANYFTQLVENQVRFTVSPCYPSWTEVPEKQWAWLRSVIEGDRSPDEYWEVCAAVDRLVDDRYQDYKLRVYKHLKEHEPSRPYGELSTEDWQKCINFFISHTFVDTSPSPDSTATSKALRGTSNQFSRNPQNDDPKFALYDAQLRRMKRTIQRLTANLKHSI